MLQTMRQLSQSWIIKTLMLVLIVSFTIWGIGDIFRGNPLQRTVAKSGKLSISVQALDMAFDKALERAHNVFGPDLTRQQAKQMGMLEDTLNNLIERAGVEQEIGRLGINVSDQQYIDFMASKPEFKDKDGKFDLKLFHEAMERAGLGQRTMVDMVRQDMERQQLLNAVTSTGPVPKTIVDGLFHARGEKRILEVVTIKNAGFANIPAPDDKALQDFYQQNGAKFMAPEYRAITIARLSVDDMAKDVSIGDDELKKSYDEKAAELTHPEQRDLVQVVVADEAKAKQLQADAKAGGDLTAAAKKAGVNVTTLDQVEQKTILPDLANAVFALSAGQISDPLKSGLGWHVIQVKKINAAGKPEFDAVKDRLRATLQRDRAIDEATRRVNELDDQLAAGHALEDIADSMKLRLVKIPALDANGKTPDGKEPEEFPDRADALKTAYGQGAGETSPVLDDKQGNYVVVRTDSVTPSALPPFEKVKDAVIAEWKKAEQAKRASAAADDVAKALRDGKPAASLAGQNGIEVRTSKPVSLLGDSDPDLPETVMAEVFKMKKGDVAAMPLPDRQLVLRLTQLVPADAAASQPQVNAITGQLTTHMPAELAEQYIKYMRVLYPVKINQDVLESLRQQGS